MEKVNFFLKRLFVGCNQFPGKFLFQKKIFNKKKFWIPPTAQPKKNFISNVRATTSISNKKQEEKVLGACSFCSFSGTFFFHLFSPSTKRKKTKKKTQKTNFSFLLLLSFHLRKQ